MATVDDDGGRCGGRGRRGERRSGIQPQHSRGGDRARGRGGRGPLTQHAAAGIAATGVPQVATPTRLPSEGPWATSTVQTESAEPRHTGDAEWAPQPMGRPHARAWGQETFDLASAAGIAAAGVPQVATPTRLPSEGPWATSTVQTESAEPRHTGDACEDADVSKMKKVIEELELKNAELKHKLEVAEAQLNKWNKYISSDPLIEELLIRCHDVFLCPNESDYQKLSVFLSDRQSKLTMNVKVPGAKVIQELKKFEKDVPIFIPRLVRASRKESKKLRRLTAVAKHILLGIIEDIYRLHRLGLSLNGKFTLTDFYWTHLKKMKLDPALKLIACQRGRDEMNNDYHRIYDIILEMLKVNDGDLETPDDLQRLLNLLNSSDPVKHFEIIRYNMSLMSEIGKKAHFLTLYGRLLQQISEDDDSKGPQDEKKSEKVLSFLSKQFNGVELEPWSNLAKENAYVGAAYERRSLQKGMMILEDPLDMLIIWRNALSHALDESIKDGEVLFKDEDLVHILESTAAGVFNELQRSMSEVGLLELPHLMRAMRM